MDTKLEKARIEFEKSRAVYAALGGNPDMPDAPDNFPDGWDTKWQPSFDEVKISSKPAPKYKLDEPITPPLLTDEVEAQLKKELDDVGMSYYQCGNYAAEMDALTNRYAENSFREGQTKDDNDTARYVLGKKVWEAWSANQNLDEARAAYETAFNAYYEYIFKRDYIGFSEGTDISKVRLERKR